MGTIEEKYDGAVENIQQIYKKERRGGIGQRQVEVDRGRERGGTLGREK